MMRDESDVDPKAVKRSSRDLSTTRDALQCWLAERLPGARVSELVAPPTNGMSSETILFDATWSDGHEELVGRIAPNPDDFPLFPTYDIQGQFRVMSNVRELTDVPVPEPLWFEADTAVLGQQFLVMRRVAGVVPPDVMPYPFGDNWLYDARRPDQRMLQDNSISVLAKLHAVADPERHFGFLHEDVIGDTPLRRHFQKELLDYYAWASKDTRSPLVERSFVWLQDNWPMEEGPTVLSWGDARLGNIMYRDFEPVAVLDWEMASLGPPEIDLGWFQYFHLFFEEMATTYGLPGMPHFMRRGDVVAQYAAVAGYEPQDMDWYGVLAATRYAIVALRTGIRNVHFGQASMPDDVDDLILHRPALQEMLAGTYWEGH
jgi:aminoglycoside phosphotransferase (APT) family kinase protein